ncbi:MAG: Coenzyme F420 hydrogenase/dehydrogenase, beta subunit C-terminal domain [Desulforegulaceae bacterium]|nr:Coenzyme F420 hydrogenase/dehydrogenase, beta subunit C-terminal domain [Desulforegulaceae bacterium]
MNSTNNLYKTSKEVIENFNCIGCGACINICPYRKLNKNNAVRIFNCNNSGGKCDLVCPKTIADTKSLTKNTSPENQTSYMGNVLKIYKSKSGKRFENLFSAKKTITALNCFILKSKVSKKILMTKTKKDLSPFPFFAESEEEIINFSKTNYCSSSPLGLVNLSKEKNYSFTGLPCQILSLAKFETLDKNFQKPFLPEIKISLFCTWSLNPEKYSNYLKKNFKNKEIKSCFINPSNKNKIFFELNDNSTAELNIDEIRKFIRKGCASCTDLTGKYSDISVGDCETDKNFNTLIIRTQKGRELVNNAVKNNYLEISDYPENTKTMLEKAAQNKSKTPSAF